MLELPFSPVNDPTAFWNPALLLYVGSILVLVFILVFHFSPQCGHANVFVFTGICSLMGSLSVMRVKVLGTSLKLTFEGNNQLTYQETWFFLLALDTFNTAVILPIYYVMFATLTILASVTKFKDWDGQSAENIISEICCFIAVLSGTNLLHSSKDFDRSSSFGGGGYALASPNLVGPALHGESRHDEEDPPPPEEVCMRRH